MNPRLTNKRLVKTLMDTKGIDSITITSKAVVVQVDKNFTPGKGQELCNKVGHDDFKVMTREGHNYIVFPRF
ncbi:MAG: hypothetical protein IJZ86_01205 [Bacteroides sp.]|nr:hypothetical protein [Bacteroides sp.]